MKKLTPKVKAIICTFLTAIAFVGIIFSDQVFKVAAYVLIVVVALALIYAIYIFFKSMFEDFDGR